MRSLSRSVCIGVAVVGWMVWVGFLWVTRHNPDSEPWMLVIRDLAQMVAGALTIAGVLACALSPALRMALAWKDIGAQQQRDRHCASCPMNPASNIVPINFHGRVERAMRQRQMD